MQLKPPLRPYPSRLFVETTSRCNLACAMCVKQSAGEHGPEGNMTAATFAALSPAFPHLDALILNGIGEPLLHPQLEDFVSRARQEMPPKGWIGFQTNGLLLDRDRANGLIRAGIDRICISLDSLDGDTFRRIREGGDVGDIDRAFADLAAARSLHPASRLETGIEFVVMRDNLHELPQVLRWAAMRGASFALVTQVVPYDAAHRSQVAYDANTNVAVAIFQKWQSRAMAEGIDLNGYDRAAWRYRKTDEDRRVVDFVARMKEEAAAAGVFLNLDRLLKRDHDWFREAEGVFAEAERVAEEWGLSLELPALVPREERRCDFVEGGGAFVSWDGDVHPCYFLWHRYRCHVQGWEQTVEPRVFGNVGKAGILDIWNGDDFRTFRTNVQMYDYPHCFSCRLAPCDYIGGDTFEQDCHIRQEPCGPCLWCMGVFRCLS